jgi:hypothetical protein
MQAGIRQNLQVLLDALLREAGKIDVLYLSVSDVSERLRGLPDTRRLSDAQEELFDETVRCLECGAYRAAAVMVWNLCYDIIRHWIHGDQERLDKFNDFLESSYRRRNRDRNDIGPKYSQIVDYDDFFSSKAPSERDVVDTAQSSELIGGKVADRLRECLRDRNDLAHPSDKTITSIQANALVEKLIDIVQNKPFTA